MTGGAVRRARWKRELLDDGDRGLERRIADTAEAGEGPEQDNGQRSGESGSAEAGARTRCRASDEVVEERVAWLRTVGAQPALEPFLFPPSA
jgi:hypothetical protein